MSSKDDISNLDIQIDIQDLKSENAALQLSEWIKQTSARMKELQRQIDALNKWVFPK